jgi:cation transport ATPase
MIEEQEESAQESTVATKEAKAEERTKKDAANQRRKYNAICLYVLGALFIFAPIYIQIHTLWALTVSVVLTSICWLGGWFNSVRMFLNTPSTAKKLVALTVFSSMASILSYALSYTEPKMPSNPSLATELRAGSFLFLFMAISIFLFNLPKLVSFFAQNKDKVKALFTAKHSVAAILSALAIGTALFQFLQVLLQIFHR